METNGFLQKHGWRLVSGLLIAALVTVGVRQEQRVQDTVEGASFLTEQWNYVTFSSTWNLEVCNSPTKEEQYECVWAWASYRAKQWREVVLTTYRVGLGQAIATNNGVKDDVLQKDWQHGIPAEFTKNEEKYLAKAVALEKARLNRTVKELDVDYLNATKKEH